MRKVVPLPGWLLASQMPRWAKMALRMMRVPKPVPPALLLVARPSRISRTR
jgi:hypothetical protein